MDVTIYKFTDNDGDDDGDGAIQYTNIAVGKHRFLWVPATLARSGRW